MIDYHFVSLVECVSRSLVIVSNASGCNHQQKKKIMKSAEINNISKSNRLNRMVGIRCNVRSATCASHILLRVPASGYRYSEYVLYIILYILRTP